MVLGNRRFSLHSSLAVKKGATLWRKAAKVSGKTHTKAQLDNYANQHNPNNKAYRANQENQSKASIRKNRDKKYDIGILDGESYGWCDD